MKNRNKYGKLKVLIVEDDSPSEVLLTELIKPFTRHALIAVSGRKAIQLCEENPDIDLILMDIRMADIDGYEAARQIRVFNKEVIIIAQTAYAMPYEDANAKEAGCNDFLTKPIYRTELYNVVQKYFEP